MPQNYVHGRHLVEALRVALKIDRPITSVSVEADCKSPGLVTIGFYATDEDLKRICLTLQNFNIIRRDCPPPLSIEAGQVDDSTKPNWFGVNF